MQKNYSLLLRLTNTHKSLSQSLLHGFALFILLFLILPNDVTAQQVSPYQTGHYSPGIANVRDYTKMIPGLVIMSYNYYGTGNQYADQYGEKHDKLYLQDLDPSLPDASLSVDLKSFATVPALFWGSNFTILGGATYLAGITPGYIWADAIVVAKNADENADSVFTQSEELKVSGFTDLNVIPFGLSWGWTHFDATFFYGFTAPTGRYDTDANDNIGLGFWTHQFQGFGYWYPNKSQATAFMLGLTYELNTKIKGEDVNPGDRFSLEWGFSQYLSERFEVSVIGGHNWQIVEDSGEDVYWDATSLDRKSMVGVSIAYWAVKNRLYVAGKYMFDFGARERFLTNGFMLNLIFVTNALDGVKKQKKHQN